MAEQVTEKTPEQIAAEQAAPPAAPPEGASDEVQAELERTRVALKAANKEAAERRKRLETLEAAEAERAKAEMSETDRLKAELEQARKDAAAANETAKQTLIRAAFVAEAAKAGVAHPEDVYRLADDAAVECDEKGNVTGVTEAVKALIDAGRVPMSGKAPAPNLDGGAGGNGGGKSAAKLSDDELAMARHLNIPPERYAAQKSAMTAEERAS